MGRVFCFLSYGTIVIPSKGWINTVRAAIEAGLVLNLKLVYGFIPMGGSIEKMIGNSAYELAREIILSYPSCQ